MDFEDFLINNEEKTINILAAFMDLVVYEIFKGKINDAADRSDAIKLELKNLSEVPEIFFKIDILMGRKLKNERLEREKKVEKNT